MRRQARGARALAAIVLAWSALAVVAPPAVADEQPPADPAVTAEAGDAPSAPVPSASSPAGALRPVDAGGVLFVSGLRTVYRPSPDPFGGTLHVELTVRNAYTKVVDASASLSARNLLGMDLGGDSSLAVRGLEPGEVRVVSREIPGVGQWGVFHVHGTVAPPTEISGVELTPLERDRWVLVPPWHLGAVVLLAGTVAWVFLRYRPVLRRRPRSARGRDTVAVAR